MMRDNPEQEGNEMAMVGFGKSSWSDELTNKLFLFLDFPGGGMYYVWQEETRNEIMTGKPHAVF
jgi:hypothetical protein